MKFVELMDLVEMVKSMEKSDENSHQDWKEDGRLGAARGQDFDLHLQSYKILQSITKKRITQIQIIQSQQI